MTDQAAQPVTVYLPDTVVQKWERLPHRNDLSALLGLLREHLEFERRMDDMKESTR